MSGNVHGDYYYTCYIYTCINILFSDMSDSGIAVFLDKSLLISFISKEHIILLEKVLDYIYQYIFYYKLKRCSFLCNNTIFLGFYITAEGMCIRGSKVLSLNEWLVNTMLNW